MASVVATGGSAQTEALGFLAEHYPALAVNDVAAIKLEAGWLVEMVAKGSEDDDLAVRIIVMVNRHGFVEEVGNSLARQSAHRCLSGMKATSTAEPGSVDREAPRPRAAVRSWS